MGKSKKKNQQNWLVLGLIALVAVAAIAAVTLLLPKSEDIQSKASFKTQYVPGAIWTFNCRPSTSGCTETGWQASNFGQSNIDITNGDFWLTGRSTGVAMMSQTNLFKLPAGTKTLLITANVASDSAQPIVVQWKTNGSSNWNVTRTLTAVDGVYSIQMGNTKALTMNVLQLSFPKLTVGQKATVDTIKFSNQVYSGPVTKTGYIYQDGSGTYYLVSKGNVKTGGTLLSLASGLTLTAGQLTPNKVKVYATLDYTSDWKTQYDVAKVEATQTDVTLANYDFVAGEGWVAEGSNDSLTYNTDDSGNTYAMVHYGDTSNPKRLINGDIYNLFSGITLPSGKKMLTISMMASGPTGAKTQFAVSVKNGNGGWTRVGTVPVDLTDTTFNSFDLPMDNGAISLTGVKLDVIGATAGDLENGTEVDVDQVTITTLRASGTVLKTGTFIAPATVKISKSESYQIVGTIPTTDRNGNPIVNNQPVNVYGVLSYGAAAQAQINITTSGYIEADVQDVAELTMDFSSDADNWSNTGINNFGFTASTGVWGGGPTSIANASMVATDVDTALSSGKKHAVIKLAVSGPTAKTANFVLKLNNNSYSIPSVAIGTSLGMAQTYNVTLPSGKFTVNSVSIQMTGSEAKSNIALSEFTIFTQKSAGSVSLTGKITKVNPWTLQVTKKLSKTRSTSSYYSLVAPSTDDGTILTLLNGVTVGHTYTVDGKFDPTVTGQAFQVVVVNSMDIIK